MKLIKPSFEIIEQKEGLDGVLKQIERAARVCYKSEDKITEDSAKGFVERMIKSGHGAMLEHGTVYLMNDTQGIRDSAHMVLNHFSGMSYSEYNIVNEVEYVTTNYRVLVENNCLEDLEFLCEPTEYHERRYTVKFVCDRAVANEFVRHKLLCAA